MPHTTNNLQIEALKDLENLAGPFIRNDRDLFICRADGAGMKKAGILSGDYLLFTGDRKAENGDIVYLEVYGQAMCRRIFFRDSSGGDPARICIRREDGITPDLIADADDVTISGVFEGLIRCRKGRNNTSHFLSPEELIQPVDRKEKTPVKAERGPLPFRQGKNDRTMRIDELGLSSRLVNRLTDLGIHT